ncbi:M60 family metallopeptidase [Limosilactobacillus equigenerosi]|uniref:M60 family metallopeptidase n=1 Tax=Limosilactobacillus equigenerosi TaxID=417373 RepID=UPI0006CF696E|nr:putative mucin/carbohydrate-binding domain-containing protein [Limosilactobacillus equigenerosi]
MNYLFFSHDSKQETVQTKWDASKSPYALMQAYNIQLQIPYSDILRVMQTNMDDLLNQYDQQVFKLYAELTGIQYNQSSHPVVRRYFAMPDKNGIGAAYYNGGRWIAINGSSVASYLTIGWLTLHEIAHGYEVPSDWMQIIDNFNNVYGTIYQAKYTYPTNQEFSHKSWIYDGGKEKNIQQVIQEVLTQHQNFNQVGLRERLILLLSLADYKNTDSWKIFNEYHRKVANDGKNSSDLGKDWIQSFKDSYNVDVTPYFLLMGVPIDQVTMLNLANSNSEPIVPLAQVVDKNKINNVIAQLGWDQDSLKNELSLVSTNDLLKTRLTGTTKLTFTNPSLAKGHQFELRNGNQIIKKFELPANGDLTFTDLPIGVYTLISDDGTISLLNPYVYVKSDSIQSQSMTLTDNILTKVRDLFTDNSYSQLKPSITLTQLKQAEELVNNLSNKALQLANSKLTQRASAMIEQITLMGGSNVIFNTISDNNGTGTLTIQSYPVQPHWAFGDDVYSTIDIYDSKGKSVYSNHIIASQTQPNKVVTLANADGYKVVITHKEGPSRLQADLGNVTITPSNKQIFMVQDGKLVPGYPNEELIVPETVSFKVGEVKNNDELLNLINPKIMPKTSALKFDIVGSDVDFDHEGNYQVVIKATDNHQKLQSIVNVKVIGNVIPTHEVGEPLIQPEKSTLTLPTHEVGEPLIQPEKPTLTLPTHEVGEPLIQPEKPTLTLPTHEVGEPLIQPEKLILSVTGNDVNSMILFEKVDNTSNKEFNLKVSHEIISTTNNKQVDKTDDKLQDMSNTLPQTGESINQANPKIGILGLLITVLMGLIGVKKYKHN